MPDVSCPRCNSPIPEQALACPNCHLLTHLAELHQISNDALTLEKSDPLAAATIWERAVPLLPEDSAERVRLLDRIDALKSGDFEQPDDPLPTAIFKTVGSMLISVVVYLLYFAQYWGYSLVACGIIATGFVILMLIHELGHVIALKYYGLRASPPIFIPFMGAVINMRDEPPNAKIEAVVGIGGPMLGTIGAVLLYGITQLVPMSPFLKHELIVVCWLAFMLNLFNLLPIPPLDGGRITAAISPKIWMLGVLGLLGLIIAEYVMHRSPSILLMMVFAFALPRVIATLKNAKNLGAYYHISKRASRTIGLLYLALGITLLFMYAITNYQARIVPVKVEEPIIPESSFAENV